MRAWDALDRAGTQAGSEPSPEWAAADAFHGHVETVLLATVPTTARGCAALARYAAEHRDAQGWVLDEDDPQQSRVLALIARSPLL